MTSWSLMTSRLFSPTCLKTRLYKSLSTKLAFTDDWFNKTYGLNLQQGQLARLVEIATTNQLLQFNGQLYQQTDGVAIGSPLGPLMANVFMCHLEEKLTRDGLMPSCTRGTSMIPWLECPALMLLLSSLVP